MTTVLFVTSQTIL